MKRLQRTQCYVHIVIVGFGDSSAGATVVVVGEFRFSGSVFTVPSSKLDGFA